MASRLILQKQLEDLLNNKNVYYQPPESIKMNYPAIRYSRDSIREVHANNSTYLRRNRYQIILISREKMDDFVDKMIELPYCSFDRSYTADNLNHYVFTLYF